jgi:hypothetical protein
MPLQRPNPLQQSAGTPVPSMTTTAPVPRLESSLTKTITTITEKAPKEELVKRWDQVLGWT